MAQAFSESDTTGVSDDIRSALRSAVESNTHSHVQSLINGVNSNDFAESWRNFLGQLLGLAKSTEVVELLLNHGANIESRGKMGSTVLMEASATDVIKMLIFDKEVELEEKDGEGKEPIVTKHISVQCTIMWIHRTHTLFDT